MVKTVLNFVWLVSLMVVVGCGRVATPPPSPVEDTAVAAADTSTPTLPAPTLTPTLTPSPEPSPTTTSIPIPAATTTPTFPQGLLFGYDIGGIWQVDVVSQEKTYLLTRENTWLDWGAIFAQNKKYLAYWLKKEDGTELWFTRLPQWQPELILTINDVVYDFALPSWGVNDRYLLLNLSDLDDSTGHEKYKTIRTYIFDVESMEPINQPYWSGDCFTLAPSSQTNKLALWCSPINEQGNSLEFLVLELDKPAWLTPQIPELITDNCHFDNCVWAPDGNAAALVHTDRYPGTLVYISTDTNESTQLDDGNTEFYGFPLWSPNNQFLYYSGACGDGSSQCPNIMSVLDGQVIWRAQNSFNERGELGIILVNLVAWSPNSQYIAIPTFATDGTTSELETHILLFNVGLQQIVSRVVLEDGVPEDIVWVNG